MPCRFIKTCKKKKDEYCFDWSDLKPLCEEYRKIIDDMLKERIKSNYYR